MTLRSIGLILYKSFWAIFCLAVLLSIWIDLGIEDFKQKMFYTAFVAIFFGHIIFDAAKNHEKKNKKSAA